MTLTKTQEFLLNGGTPEDLKSQLGIEFKRHPDYPNLVSFKYSQIDSPMGNPIVQECRGLILDEANNWNIVFYGLNKFFNLGEGHAATIDWNRMTVYEKIDDTCVGLYYYDNKWLFCTLGSPNANGKVGDTGITFDTLIRDTWKSLGYIFPNEYIYSNSSCLNKSYVFGLTTPLNKIVVNHKESNLYYIAVRDNLTLKEESISSLERIIYQWEEVPYGGAFSNVSRRSKLEDVVKAVNDIDGSKHEGFVVVDENFNRIKLKSPQYILLHRFKSSFSNFNLFNLALINESSEITTYFPEYEEQLNAYQEQIKSFILKATEVWDTVKDIPFNQQKEFAMIVKDTIYAPIMFTHRKNIKSGEETSISHIVRNSKVELIYNLINKTT
jgi:hypothetical protein